VSCISGSTTVDTPPAAATELSTPPDMATTTRAAGRSPETASAFMPGNIGADGARSIARLPNPPEPVISPSDRG
jgi:hypothetical protein